MHMEGGAKATLSHSARIRLLLSHSGLCPAVSLDPGEFSAKGPTLPHLLSSSVCWALPGCHSSYSRTSQWTGSPTNCNVRPCGSCELGSNINFKMCRLHDDRLPNCRSSGCDVWQLQRKQSTQQRLLAFNGGQKRLSTKWTEGARRSLMSPAATPQPKRIKSPLVQKTLGPSV